MLPGLPDIPLFLIIDRFDTTVCERYSCSTDMLVIIVAPEMSTSRAVHFAISHMIFIGVPKHFTHRSRNSFYGPS